MNGEDRLFWVAMALLVVCAVSVAVAVTPRLAVCTPYARVPLYSVVAEARNLTVINAGARALAVLAVIASGPQTTLAVARATNVTGGTPVPVAKLDKNAPEPNILALANTTTETAETLLASSTPTAIETHIVLRPGEAVTVTCTETCTITLHMG